MVWGACAGESGGVCAAGLGVCGRAGLVVVIGVEGGVRSLTDVFSTFWRQKVEQKAATIKARPVFGLLLGGGVACRAALIVDTRAPCDRESGGVWAAGRGVCGRAVLLVVIGVEGGVGGL